MRPLSYGLFIIALALPATTRRAQGQQQAAQAPQAQTQHRQARLKQALAGYELMEPVTVTVDENANSAVGLDLLLGDHITAGITAAASAWSRIQTIDVGFHLGYAWKP